MKLIRFVPGIDSKEKMLLDPTPIKDHLPEWYRVGEHSYKAGAGKEQPGMKSCAPFLDVMLTGYALVTPFDIYVGRNEDGTLKIRWNGPTEWANFIMERPKALGETIPRPPGFAPNGLVWSSQWGWKTPRKYSTIVCHPFNRQDLPFFTLAAVVDSDKFTGNGNIPFFIKEDFIGIIPAGTPFAQIIPFKRKLWGKVSDYGLYAKGVKDGEEVRIRSYKKFLWIKKSYK
jgi:hypothetical protein